MERVDIVKTAFNRLRANGMVKSQREFAQLLELTEGTISKALKGEKNYASDIMIARINALMMEKFGEAPEWDKEPVPNDVGNAPLTLPIIPTKAMAGTLGEFSQGIKAYECERMISPIQGADYAIKVSGDSMVPDIPNGSTIIIKKIWEEEFVEWGKIFCLDTRNGAVIKRVYPTDNPEVVECRSINPEYPPFKVNVKSINGWYRVLMVLSLK